MQRVNQRMEDEYTGGEKFRRGVEDYDQHLKS